MSSIRKNIATGILYTAMSKYSSVVISIFITAILARLLTPAEFGIVAIVSVFTNFFNLLSNFGLSTAVIQNKSLDDKDIQSIFSFSIIFGFFLSASFFLLAPFIASFYNDERLINLVHLMSIGIFFQSIAAVPHALNLKVLRFKQIGVVSIIVHLISGTIGIILAYNGFSYYSLVINSLISGFLTFISFLYLAPVIPVLKIKINSLKKIARFSSFQFLFSFVNYFAVNTDNLLIGKYFSTSALGIYSKAYQLMRIPIRNLTFVITPVLQPILSDFQNDKKTIYNAYYKLVTILATIGFPLSIYLYFNANELITIVYGSQWQESIPIFELLAFTAGIQIVLSSSGSIFQSTNRTDLLLYAGIIGSASVLLGIFYGVFIGKSLEDIGLGIIIGYIINIFQANYLLVKIDLKFQYFKFLKVFLYPIFTALIIGIILFIVDQFLIQSLIVSLLIKSVLALITYLFVLYFSKNNRILFNEYLGKKLNWKLKV